jgi:HK97 family phage major capsid protein
MNDKELKRLNELKQKNAETLTNDEVQELIELQDKKSIDEQVKEAVKNAIRSLPKDYSNINVTQNKQDSNDFVRLLKAIRHDDYKTIKEINEKAASPMVEGVASDGGYLVPAVTVATIEGLIPTYGQARQVFQQIPMGKSNIIKLPKEGTAPNLYWLDEAAEKTSSKPTIDIINLIAKKAAAIVVVSDELLDDANVSLGEYLMKKFAQIFGIGEDIAMFKGTGSPFTGLFSNTHTFGNTVTLSGGITTLTYKNLLDVIYGIDQNYATNASWLLHPTIMSVIRNISDSNGMPIFQASMSESSPGNLLGYPVKLIQNAPTSAAEGGSIIAVFGNTMNSYIGTKQDLTVKVLTEATIDGTSLAQYDLTAFRVVERIAFNAGLTAGYSVLKLPAS